MRGRTLTAYNQVADQWIGIVTKAKLTIRLKNEETLVCKLSNAEYAEVNMTAPANWNMESVERQLHYQKLSLSGKPFEVQLKEGLIRSLIVDKEVNNMELNCIKGFLSQFQVDTQGKNLIKSKYNQLPEGEQVNSFFKTMEV